MYRLLGILTVTAALALASMTGAALKEHQQEMVPVQVRVESRVPTPQAAELLAMGHREALADLLWLSLLGYWFDNLERARMESGWLNPHLDAILGLDPGFRMVYVWAGYLVHLSSDLREEAVEEANRYLRMGLRRFPTDWQLHYILSFNLLWELRPEDPERRAALRAEGMALLRQAASLPGAPEHLHNLIASLDMQQAAWSLLVSDLPARFISTRTSAEARNLRGHLYTYQGGERAVAWATLRDARVRAAASAGIAGLRAVGEALALEYGLAEPMAAQTILRLEEQR